MKKIFSHKNLRLLTWFNFFNDFRPYAPIAILYFAHLTGSYGLGLSIMSITSVSVALFEVPTGMISDFLGRKKTMIWGSLLSALGILFFALSQSFWLLAIGAVLQGIAITLFSGNNDALLYDTLKEQNQENDYAEFLGKVSSMFQVGLASSALIGGFLADWSFKFVFWISVIPQLICLVISLFIREPKKHYDQVSTNLFDHLKGSLTLFKTNWKLKYLSLSSILSYGMGEAMYQFKPAFFALLWPTWALGIPRFLANGLAAVGFRFSGALIKRWTALKLLISGTSIGGIGNLIAYGFPTILSPFIIPISSFFFGTGTVSRNSLMQKEFTDNQRATMSSLNNLFGHLLFAVFAIFLGTLADKIGPAKALVLGELLLLPAIYIYWRLFKSDR